MGFLITQIIFCILIAFALGLLISWLLCRRPSTDDEPLRTELGEAKSTIRNLERKIASMQSERVTHFPVPTPPADPAPEASQSAPPVAPADEEDVDDAPSMSGQIDLGPTGGPAAAAFIDEVPLAPMPPPPAPLPTDMDGPSAAYDDLKRISGIGPAIEQQLAEIGITTYRQIAHFSDEDIERVGEHIDFFADRIRREGWVVQAASLHRETYGTQP